MNNDSPIALFSRRVLLPNGISPATLMIENGKITNVISGFDSNHSRPLLDFEDAVIMPGLIDSHVHINEPGRTHWEGFETATKAAAAGGITTLVDMPLNSSPVTINADAFQAKLQSSVGKRFVHCGFYGGIVPDNSADIEALLAAGALGIKAFLTHSGIDDFPQVTVEHLRSIMPVLKHYDRPLLVHCELDQPHPGIQHLEQNPTNYSAYLQSRPRSWEDRAIDLMIRLCEEFNAKVHIVHLSSSNSIENIQKAKTKNLPLTVETCPHYLFFDADDIRDEQTVFKCAPPIRERENNEKLWQALEDDTIDFIVTDHSPAPPDMKSFESGRFDEAWGGIAGLQFSLSAMWTKARARGWDITRLNEIMSYRVAKFLNLAQTKGQIIPGYDADLTVWRPEEAFVVNTSMIWHRHNHSPYVGQELYGKVEACFIDGKMIYDGNFKAKPSGRILLQK